MTIKELFQQEGDLYTEPNKRLTSPDAATKGTVLAALTMFSPGVPYGFMFTCNSVKITSNIGLTCVGTLSQAYNRQTNAVAIPKGGYDINFTIPSGGGTVELDFRDVVMFEVANIRLICTLGEDRADGYTIDLMTQGGKLVANDMNLDAKLVYLSLGDSTTWTTISRFAPQYYGETLYASRTAKALRDAGLDVRRASRGFGGSFAADWMLWAKNGGLGEQKFDLVTFGIGTNDAANGAVTQTFTDNIKYTLLYLFGRNPSASILLVCPPPTDVATRTPYIQGYRDALAALVEDADFAAYDLRYVDSTENFALIADNFTEITPGTWLHPLGGTGHAIIADNIWPVVQQSYFYQSNKR